MKKILLPLMAVAALLFAACENDQDVALELTQQKGVTFIVPDFQNADGTRMAVDIDASGATFTWTAGDTIGVFPANGYQTAFPISGGEGTNTAVFDGADWALRPSASYAAYYPFKLGMDFGKENITVSYLGQTQDGNGSTAHLGNYDFLASVFNTVSADGNVNFILNHLGCLVRFQLIMPEADTYTNMTLSCDGATFMTTGKFDLTAATPALTSKISASSISLGLTNVATTVPNEVLTLYMMLPPMDLSGKNLAITVSGDKDYTSSIVAGKDMKAGSIYGYSNSMVLPHEYVDLGITDNNGNPIYWATCNLGASTPEEYGDYFAWGEIESYYSEDYAQDYSLGIWKDGKSSGYNWTSYKFCNGSQSGITKYSYPDNCIDGIWYNGSTFIGDNKIVLESSDDVATAIWGDSWQMPTIDEYYELANDCYWEWTDDYNGSRVAGFIVYKVKSIYDKGVKKYRGSTTSTAGHYSLSDNHIFLPASGCRYERLLFINSENMSGRYWLKSCIASDSWGESSESLSLLFVPSYSSWSYESRCHGLTVRPVYHPNEVKATSISLSSSSLTLSLEGATSTLTANVFPSNVSTSKIVWVSSNTSIATVSNGEVTPVGEGTCYISAITTDGSNCVASCEIVVDGSISEPDGYIDGYGYVDLGLSSGILWAIQNVGATCPEEYGGYFAWGEVVAYNHEDFQNATNYYYSGNYKKTYYDWCTYKWVTPGATESSGINKYICNLLDTPYELDSSDDAATVNWGSEWRMPTLKEMVELYTECEYHEVIMSNGKSATKFIGPSKKSIVLPKAGCRYYSFLADEESCIYWTSTIASDEYAYNLLCSGNGIVDMYDQLDTWTRWSGLSIRPVCKRNPSLR